MKIFMTAAFVCAALLTGGAVTPAVAQDAAPAVARVGEKAPGFTLTDSKGKEHSLGDYAGKVVVLEWTNHECPYVRKFYDAGVMQERQRAAAADDVVWLTVASSAPGKQGHLTAEKTEELIGKESSAAAARLLDEDGAVGRMYSAKTTPHMFVIDGAGTLVYDGAIDDAPSADQKSLANAKDYVSPAVAAAKAGQAADPAQTKPYGCAVKYAE